MEKCKFCEAQLEEGVTLCPSCGKDNAEAAPEEAAAVETEVSAEAAVVEEPAAQEIAEEVMEETPAAEETAEAETAEEAPVAEEAPAEAKKATPGKIALAVVAIVVLVALIVAMLMGGMGGKTGGESATTPAQTVEAEPTTPPTAPADTGANDETCKGSYSVSDEEAIAGADTVIATIGDAELTNAVLQMYYWSYVSNYVSSEYGYQAMMYGLLNLAQPLETQTCLVDEGLTWQQYFLKCSLQNWQTIQAMALEAEANGHTISEEIQTLLDGMPEEMAAMAEQYGAESVEAMLAQNMGAGVTMEDFIDYQRVYYLGAPYYSEMTSQFTATPEEIEAFFNEHEEEYLQNGLTKDSKVVDVRHVLIMPEGATNETIRTETFSDEAWAAAEKQANELLEGWLAGDKTEDSFAAMANEHTHDGNDANMDGEPDGGLYTGVTEGQMVAEFEDWCFDAARQTGDTGIVKTMFGYHIMYYVGGELTWPMYAEQDILAMKENEFLMGIVDKYPMEVDYNAIQLASIVLQ